MFLTGGIRCLICWLVASKTAMNVPVAQEETQEGSEEERRG